MTKPITPDETAAWTRGLDAFCRKAKIVAIFGGLALGLALGILIN